MVKETLDKLLGIGYFNDIDIHFCRFIEKISGGDENVSLAAALVSRATLNGNICLDLKNWAAKTIDVSDTDDLIELKCPALEDWLNSLRKSRAVGEPGEDCPLILSRSDKLYLNRYFEYEKGLTDLILSRMKEIKDEKKEPDPVLFANKIHEFFPDGEEDGIDWQKVAAFISATKRFSVISGGPGTGKTYVIANLIAVLVSVFNDRPYRIYLCTPTGKAAQRLKEAIGAAKGKLKIDPLIKEKMPSQVYTIHRLLQPSFARHYFRYNSQKKLPADTVIVDEASMVDLALMYKLMSALHSSCRVILVGDKNQLSSVEAGAVLGDISGGGREITYSERFYRNIGEFLRKTDDVKAFSSLSSAFSPVPLNDHIVVLRKSYRFDEKSGISSLSRRVNSGDARGAMEILKSGVYPNIRLEWQHSAGIYEEILLDKLKKKYLETVKSGTPSSSLVSLNRFQVLCAVRKGPLGVERINEMTELLLKRDGYVREGAMGGGYRWYHGRPVMVTENDYQNSLFNGDLGICLNDGKGNLSVYFQGEDNTMRKMVPYRLGSVETVFAMTIHKSQGSEFDDVLLILPNQDSSILTRELIYTGITRARKSVTIWASEEIFRKTIERRILRDSGLLDALWGHE